MSNSALKKFATNEKVAKTETPQNVRTPGRTDEVKNNAGGYVFKVSEQNRLERFLILGTDGGTYYVGQKDLTSQNVDFIRKMIAKDADAVLKTVISVSDEGRAYSNSPAIFVLALVLTEGTNKAAAKAAVSKVVRTGTHLFEFAGYIDSFGGWGRAKREAIANWYTEMDPESLAYQAVKYRQRNGWTHRDLFRKSHPKGVDSSVGDFILGKPHNWIDDYNVVNGFKEAQKAETSSDTVKVLKEYKTLPWEALKTEHLTDVKVWKTLFYNGQLRGQALIRNITRLAKAGAFSDLQFAADYAAALTDEEMIRKTRLHPINYLNALVVYTEGQVDRDTGFYSSRRKNKTWVTESVIVDALNDGFYKAFKTVEPAGKRTGLFVDVSGSMGQNALGLDLSCAQVSGAMAMTVARTEPAHVIRGFTSGNGGYSYRGGGAELTDLGISARTELNTAMNKVKKNNFGGTDCAQPMVWALENNIEIDTFVVITDNETWAGTIKPSQAIVKYRKETGIEARLAVLGVASTGFSIADPKDAGQMDFVGFDSNAPRVLADFSAGRI